MLKVDDAEFTDFFETLKQMSYNKNAKEYLTQSELEAVNFDRYTASKYEYTQENIPSSNDALFLTLEYNYFIEFKAGKEGNIKSKELYKKNKDSIDTLVIKAGENIDDIKAHYVYILVYKKEDKPRTGIGMYLAKYAGESFFPFNLDEYKENFFNDAHALDYKDFNENFINTYLR